VVFFFVGQFSENGSRAGHCWLVSSSIARSIKKLLVASPVSSMQARPEAFAEIRSAHCYQAASVSGLTHCSRALSSRAGFGVLIR
jgi:hypothetical protein